jgi:hypothetical protein
VAPTLRSQKTASPTQKTPEPSSAEETPTVAQTLSSLDTINPPCAPTPMCEQDSDNSDSDSDSVLFILHKTNAYMSKKTAYMNPSHAYTQSSMSSHYATVDHPIIKHCPIFSARDITPKALINLEDAHNEYFIAEEINETDKVKKILGGFKCMHIHNWIASEREVLS